MQATRIDIQAGTVLVITSNGFHEAPWWLLLVGYGWAVLILLIQAYQETKKAAK